MGITSQGGVFTRVLAPHLPRGGGLGPTLRVPRDTASIEQCIASIWVGFNCPSDQEVADTLGLFEFSARRKAVLGTFFLPTFAHILDTMPGKGKKMTLGGGFVKTFQLQLSQYG